MGNRFLSKKIFERMKLLVLTILAFLAVDAYSQPIKPRGCFMFDNNCSKCCTNPGWSHSRRLQPISHKAVPGSPRCRSCKAEYCPGAAYKFKLPPRRLSQVKRKLQPLIRKEMIKICMLIDPKCKVCCGKKRSLQALRPRVNCTECRNKFCPKPMTWEPRH